MGERLMSLWHLTNLCTPFAATLACQRGFATASHADAMVARESLAIVSSEKTNGIAFFATYATPLAKVLSRFFPSPTSKPHIATGEHHIHTRRPVLEECSRFVTRPFRANRVFLSAMLGIAPHL